MVNLRQAEAHGPATAPGKFAHEPDLVRRLGQVPIFLAQAVGPLKNAATVTAENIGEREHLVVGRVRARNVTTVGHLVEERATGREAERASSHRVVDQLGHRGQIVGRCGSLIEAPLTHHRGAHRAVADQPTDVWTFRNAIEPGQVAAVTGPVPRQTFENRRPGNVFDALHHLGQKLTGAPIVRHWSEGDPAVAQGHGRDAVPAARRADRIPCQLRIEMRVDIDKARGDEPVRRIDRAHGVTCPAGLDRHDAITAHHHICTKRSTSGAIDYGAVANYQVCLHANLHGDIAMIVSLARQPGVR